MHELGTGKETVHVKVFSLENVFIRKLPSLSPNLLIIFSKTKNMFKFQFYPRNFATFPKETLRHVT